MEIKVEFGRADKNINPYYEPLDRLMRGKWQSANIAPGLVAAKPAAAQLPNLPGYMLAIDPDKGTLRLWDPINNSRDRSRIEAEYTRYFGSPQTRFLEEQKVTLPKATVRKHLLWLYIMVESGDAELKEGKWPDWVGKERDERRERDAERVGMTPEEIAESKLEPVKLQPAGADA